MENSRLLERKTIPFMLGALLLAHVANAASVLPEATAAAEACQSSWRGGMPQIAEITRPSEAVLCVRGVFQLESLTSVRAITNPAAIQTLVISSDGGFTEPAIELAKLAEGHRWLIVVKDQCLSSCANYVFLSRTKKVVLPESMVGWHGLPMDPSEFDPVAFEKWKQQMRRDHALPAGWEAVNATAALSFLVHSKEFLAERGIPAELCRSRPQIGHSEAYVARLQTLGRSGKNPFWSYGREVLERKFGVRDILYMWEPRTPEEGTELASRRFNADLFFFDLSGH